MAASEAPVREAVLLAVEELNAKGGVVGRSIQVVEADGASDPAVFAREAQRLIATERVATLFGCWTSASRKAVKTVVERYDHLLFYPVQYEGLEESPNIVYLGASPNQQILPAVSWSFAKLGRRFALVGSDYVFPRTAGAIIRDLLELRGGEVVAEHYLPLGATDFGAVVADLAAKAPDVILNTINGDSNVAFFRALRAAGLTSQRMPTLSFSLGEADAARIGLELLTGDYAAWNYFETIQSAENRRFLAAFRARGGLQPGDPGEAAYLGVNLWAQAVRDAGVATPQAIREAARNQSFRAPEGVVTIDSTTGHTWKTARVGRLLPDGQFEVVWSSEKPVRPAPFPPFRTRDAWEQFLLGLSRSWGGAWARPV